MLQKAHMEQLIPEVQFKGVCVNGGLDYWNGGLLDWAFFYAKEKKLRPEKDLNCCRKIPSLSPHTQFKVQIDIGSQMGERGPIISMVLIPESSI